ncbi:hypothetical protein BDY21DRAFT_167775 [Lineolata rhizophorae]|uniref:Leucine rich repeat protein n=1 Tax=Lineolata rhizophorae TaxID=578093 RepID=A0A6A6P993_9PEZI|nr:hypothetical protein BDY21DRAFT_167775 [Lineolata rhizophorae]
MDVTSGSRLATSCRLETLNLSRNALTTKSLRNLAEVVLRAPYDLKDLNLSENCICVHGPEEAADWEYFLESFRECRTLNTLDLSKNDLSGALAFEILARVYSRHPVVDPAIMGAASASHQIEFPEENVNDITARTNTLDVTPDSPHSMTASNLSLTHGTILKKRVGIRGVPNIILSDVGMTDTGALFLSYVLANHYYPPQWEGLQRSVTAGGQTKKSEGGSTNQGLAYAPNPTLSPAGEAVLKQAEESRRELLEDTSDAGSFVLVGSTQSIDKDRKSSVSYHNRRRNHSFVEVGSPISKTLASARHAVQRRAIPDTDPDGTVQRLEVQLWKLALQLLCLSRTVFLVQMPDYIRREILPEPVCAILKEAPNGSDCSALMLPTAAGPEAVVSGNPGQTMRTAASLFDYTRPSPLRQASPKWPSVQKQPNKGENAASYASMAESSKATQNGNNKNVKVCIENPYLSGKLPVHIWQRILALSTDPNGVLSKAQQKAVVNWAGNKCTLRTERGLLGKPRSVQIWNVLDNMGCLEYEMKV